MEPKGPKDQAHDSLRQEHLLREALTNPDVMQSISEPNIDRTHTVPSGAISTRAGGLTYVSKLLPAVAIIAGRTIDPALPLNVHEQVEAYLMRVHRMVYAAAHAIALLAEKWFVLTVLHVPWDGWEHWIN